MWNIIYSKRVLFLVLFMFQLGIGQQKNKINKKIYTTKSLGDLTAPVIDGYLTDESWNIVDWTGDYIENLPNENTKPIEQTKFKIVYDKEFIYFGFRCYDKGPKGIVKRLSRRDGFEGDWIEINISSHNDQLTSFSFAASVAGVKSDGFISDNGKTWEGNWNPIWYLKTNIDDEGWTAEIKIPLSQLKFSDAPEQVWGLQSTRRYFRTEERSVWQRIPLDAPGWVSEFGELHGLIGLSPQRQIEIQPFVLSKLETYPQEDGNPFKTGKDFKLNGGLDAKVGITNDLTLNLTINPDFGQVEADPAAIVLDGFQVFYDERRPFFVENKNIFNYTFADDQDNLFYSRRIGRNPNGQPNIPDGAFMTIPNNTTILGAAKFSGKTKNGWSIGILESVTDKEYAKIQENNERREVIVEPLTNYFVGRAQKDFNNRKSYFGVMFTGTNRNLETDYLQFLHKSAYTAGIDFRNQWKNRKYYFKGNFVISKVNGSEEAITATQRNMTHLFQRTDAGHLSVDPKKTSLTGTGGKFEMGKASIGNWRYKGSVIWRSPELELNDIGFLRQADEIKQYTFLSYETLKPFGAFRKIATSLEQFSIFDFEGNYNKMQYTLGSDAMLKNNWNIVVSAIYKPVNYSNSILQGGPRFRYSEDFFKSVSVSSDSRKKLRYSIALYDNKGKDNSFSYSELNLGLIYQPVNSFMLSINPVLSSNKNKLQYITETNFNKEARYITANLTQNTLSASIRFDYNINPNLTIQYYGQPFISRGRYNHFNKVINPVAKYYGDRISLFNQNQIEFNETKNRYEIDEDTNDTVDYTISNPDFSFVQFRSNLVARWEYIPGSELFLVWSQGITGNGNPNENLVTELDSLLLGRKPTNTFLIKMTYRFMF
ncbi:DUF5916 domain-containing protein [Flavobacterium sp. 3-210]